MFKMEITNNGVSMTANNGSDDCFYVLVDGRWFNDVGEVDALTAGNLNKALYGQLDKLEKSMGDKS